MLTSLDHQFHIRWRLVTDLISVLLNNGVGDKKSRIFLQASALTMVSVL